MKISILTFSKEINYGANLQCYALCKILQDIGHEVNILDIQLKKESMRWYSYIMRIPMIYSFKRFQKQYIKHYTRPFRSIDDLRQHCPKSDLYIVGSDQVWNPDITKKLDPLVYFFSFLPKEAHRISYAASFGKETWDASDLTNKVYKLLHQFESVSVREEAGIKICKHYFDIDAIHVLDPTLLLSSYDDICGPYDISRETNDLIYFTFTNEPSVRKTISDFAESQGLQAVHICSNHSYSGFKQKRNLSIKAWLNTIRYSKIIVTNSFHCMVFCLIFHKQFVAIPGKADRTSRQKGLLNQLGLLDNYCCDSKYLYQALENSLNKKIDYKDVDDKIHKLRDKSLKFITNNCNS